MWVGTNVLELSMIKKRGEPRVIEVASATSFGTSIVP